MSALRETGFLCLLLAAVGIVYLAICYGVGWTAQGPVLLGLLLLTILLAIFWMGLRWLSPLRGMFGSVAEEMMLVRVIERELARSLRYDAPMVVAILWGRRLPQRAITDYLRISDLVLRGASGQLVVVMTETPPAQGRMMVDRLIAKFPIMAATLTSDQAVKPDTSLAGFGQRYVAQAHMKRRPALALLHSLQAGIFYARLQVRRDQPVPVNELTAADIRYVNRAA